MERRCLLLRSLKKTSWTGPGALSVTSWGGGVPQGSIFGLLTFYLRHSHFFFFLTKMVYYALLNGDDVEIIDVNPMLIDDWRSMLAVRAGSVHLLHLHIGTSLVFNILNAYVRKSTFPLRQKQYICVVFILKTSSFIHLLFSSSTVKSLKFAQHRRKEWSLCFLIISEGGGQMFNAAPQQKSDSWGARLHGLM